MPAAAGDEASAGAGRVSPGRWPQAPSGRARKEARRRSQPTNSSSDSANLAYCYSATPCPLRWPSWLKMAGSSPWSLALCMRPSRPKPRLPCQPHNRCCLLGPGTRSICRIFTLPNGPLRKLPPPPRTRQPSRHQASRCLVLSLSRPRLVKEAEDLASQPEEQIDWVTC